MSITRDRKLIVVECDHCHATLETETEEFEEARNIMAKENWTVTNYFGKWLNFCSRTCKYDYEKERSKIKAKEK